MSSSEEFLERIQTGRHPLYGVLTWDGETQEMSIAVHFELNRGESAETVRERAWRYFKQLTPGEWLALEIELTLRDGKPVRAVLKPRSGGPTRINTARLRELQEVL